MECVRGEALEEMWKWRVFNKRKKKEETVSV